MLEYNSENQSMDLTQNHQQGNHIPSNQQQKPSHTVFF